MLTVSPSSDPAAAMLAWTRDWFAMLADGRMAEACDALDEPNSYGRAWSAASLDGLIRDTYGPGTVFCKSHPEGPQFSYPDDARGDPRAEVVPFEDGSGFSLDHDVPLNGEWSDLTAQFEFRVRETGLAVVLHDLHVL